ncbi:MAG: hypothetical protein OMM_01727 [Candidatus Magnetoglobus multicellularis str. Araruama]|uniref:Response regulatory domain-containing protein n=1 Tax=Candidatus Magnetoglobus multicellularis str. Araruama TaxID=890399 RepID=A0A1V1PBZ0_9BACT|nr:MAG: hypothetical protein OMM_01727 [Candidatus Magnetoglobus multicellularis str. Araruama]
MPNMNGEQVASIIKKDDLLKDTALIAMVDINVAIEKEQLFNDLVTKPPRHGHLYRALCKALNIKTSTEKLTDEQKANSQLMSDLISDALILLVEDNLINQKVAISILEGLGYRLDVASNGLEAVHALEKKAYDLVLMDIQMPEMDGFEATNVIRNQSSRVINHDIPIIAMTAHAMSGYKDICIKAGMNDYVNKPIQPDKLTKVINQYLLSEAASFQQASDNSIENPKQIMIADSNVFHQKIMIALLKEHECRVDVFEDSQSVLKGLETGQYYLIIVNSYLKDIEGLELIKKIRTQQQNHNVPIIAFNEMRDNNSDLYGINAFISQTICPKELLATLNHLGML